MQIDSWLLAALGMGALAALVIVFVHFAFWRQQIGDGWARPVAYVIGVGILTGCFGGWAVLAPSPVAPAQAWVAWCVITGLGGGADLVAWAYHRWEAAIGRATIRTLSARVKGSDDEREETTVPDR